MFNPFVNSRSASATARAHTTIGACESKITMELPRTRVNTMRIQFGRGTTEPKDNEIFSFFKSTLMLACEDLLCMYREQSEFCIYVKFKTEELLQSTLDRLPAAVTFKYHNGVSITVNLSSAISTFKYVRLFNIPPEVEDREIAGVLTKYGKIQRLVREKYPADTGYPIWTSVRGAHMEITTEIPAALHVRNYQVRVFYSGMKNKCFLCGSVEHQKADCPSRQSSNLRTGGTSFKDVLAGTSRGKQVNNKDENIPEQSQMVVIGTLDPRQRAERFSAVQKSKELLGAAAGVAIDDGAVEPVEPAAVDESVAVVESAAVVEAAAVVESVAVFEPATIVEIVGDNDVAAAPEISGAQSEMPEAMEVWTVQERKRGRSRKVANRVKGDESLSESDQSTTEAKKSARFVPVPSTQKFLKTQGMITRARSRSGQVRSPEKSDRKETPE